MSSASESKSSIACRPATSGGTAARNCATMASARIRPPDEPGGGPVSSSSTEDVGCEEGAVSCLSVPCAFSFVVLEVCVTAELRLGKNFGLRALQRASSRA